MSTALEKLDCVIVAMTEGEARHCIDEIKLHVGCARNLLLELYERQGWNALGYNNWRECVEAEFEQSQAYLYRQLAAGEIERRISPIGEIGVVPESQLRPLSALEPEQQREAWEKAVRTAPDGKVTAAHVQEVVNEIRAIPNHVNVTLFSHKSKEYYTPKEYADAARLVMGKIDLDPASCDEAQKNISAKKYYTEKDDGLAQEWRGKVWLNPPYSKTEGESNQAIWSHRLVTEYKSGNVTQAILLVKAALGYKWFEELWDIAPAVCFARNRLSFILEDGTDEGQSKQGTAFFYFGENIEKFIEVFTRFGRVITRGKVYQCRES